MRKRAYTKVVALVSIVAILSLTAPGLFAHDTFKHMFRFQRFLDIPAVFLYSFVYFTPIYDIGKVFSNPAIENNETRKVKVSGGLDVDRVSRED